MSRGGRIPPRTSATRLRTLIRVTRTLAARTATAGFSAPPFKPSHSVERTPQPWGTVAAVAKVVETLDLTAPSQNGWAVGYRIRRDDGEELHAEVRCWEKAHVAAERSANADALAAIADRGNAAALEYAESVESPATRGAVVISIWFDPADEGNLRHRVSYERAPA